MHAYATLHPAPGTLPSLPACPPSPTLPLPPPCRRALGDCVAQRVEGNKFDARRCVMTTAYGALCVGPFGHAWYLGLDRAARAVFTPGSAAFVAGKVRGP